MRDLGKLSPRKFFFQISGGIYGAVRPDPIPNSAVKRIRADDSLAHASAKVGSCRLIKKIRANGSFLFL